MTPLWLRGMATTSAEVWGDNMRLLESLRRLGKKADGVFPERELELLEKTGTDKRGHKWCTDDTTGKRISCGGGDTAKPTGGVGGAKTQTKAKTPKAAAPTQAKAAATPASPGATLPPKIRQSAVRVQQTGQKMATAQQAHQAAKQKLTAIQQQIHAVPSKQGEGAPIPGHLVRAQKQAIKGVEKAHANVLKHFQANNKAKADHANTKKAHGETLKKNLTASMDNMRNWAAKKQSLEKLADSYKKQGKQITPALKAVLAHTRRQDAKSEGLWKKAHDAYQAHQG